MDLSPDGRLMVGTVALIVAGFALGAILRVGLTGEQALALLSAAGVLLLLVARRNKG